MENFQKMLDELATITGLDSLAIEDNGGCAIKLDNIIINMQYIEDTEQCYFFSVLFPIPIQLEEKNSLYERLLVANCFFRDTGGGILGIDKGIDAVTYAAKFSIANISGSDFANYLEDFVNTAEEFIEKFNKDDQESSGKTDNNSENFNNYLRV